MVSSPSARSASLSMVDMKIVLESSSLCPGISTVISSHSFWPFGTYLLASFSSSSSLFVYTCRRGVRSTSAFTPTTASVPSEKHTRALPFVPGRMAVSAVRGRNCVAERPSGLMGGVRLSEVWR